MKKMCRKKFFCVFRSVSSVFTLLKFSCNTTEGTDKNRNTQMKSHFSNILIFIGQNNVNCKLFDQPKRFSMAFILLSFENRFGCTRGFELW